MHQAFFIHAVPQVEGVSDFMDGDFGQSHQDPVYIRFGAILIFFQPVKGCQCVGSPLPGFAQDVREDGNEKIHVE